MTKPIHKRDLLVIGNLTLDIIHGVDRIPRLDETGLVLSKNVCFGGRAGNIAVIAAGLGLDVAIASITGADFTQSGYRHYLLKRKVDVDKVEILKTEKCAKTQVFRRPDGKHIYFFQANVQERNHGLDLEREELNKFKIVYLTSFDSEKAVIEIMRKLETLDNVFFGLGEEIYRKSKGFLELAIGISSYLNLNEKEFETLLEKIGLSAIDDVFDIGTKLRFVCVSLGDKGSTIYTPEQRYFVPPVPPQEMVSTLGAGDAYVAGLVYGIVNSWDIKECGRLGSVVASFILEREGAQSNLPNWTNIRKRYSHSFGE